MTGDLNVKLLRTFVAVAAELSFTEAARRRGMSQSAMSGQIRQLEAILGHPLLERDTHTVRVTAAGEHFLGYAHRILALHDEALQDAAEHPRRQLVRFGVSEDFAITHLPAFLDKIRREHPLLDVELCIALSVDLHRRLRAGELNVILAMRLSSTHGPDAFRAEPLFTDRMVWVSAPGFRIEEEPAIPLVLYPRPSLTRDAALSALEQAGRGYRTAATSTSLAGLRAAALGGLGIMPFAASLIPEGLEEVDNPDLPALPQITFAIVTRNTRTTATEQFVEALHAHREAFLG